jgi:hypothetical protein
LRPRVRSERRAGEVWGMGFFGFRLGFEVQALGFGSRD